MLAYLGAEAFPGMRRRTGIGEGAERERAMNFEKFTERARGFLQAAQTIALRENHQRFLPEHLLKALLDDDQGMAVGPDRARRRRRRRRRGRAVDAALAQGAAGRGRRPLGAWTPRPRRCSTEAEKLAKKAGDSYVTVERMLLALALTKSGRGRRAARRPASRRRR